MTQKRIISDQQKASLNRDTLLQWIDKTPPYQVPRNQFGRANRGKIMSELGIRGSKDQEGIKNAFAKLDEALTGSTLESTSRGSIDAEVKALRKRITELEKRLTLVSNELNNYKKHDKLIEHLIKTGSLLK